MPFFKRKSSPPQDAAPTRPLALLARRVEITVEEEWVARVVRNQPAQESPVPELPPAGVRE
jgi:hypothetical protein